MKAAASPERDALAAPGGRTLRMRDVAKLAGVSHQTVSRVLNNPEAVSEATTRRVLDVINTYGYRPSPVARALTTRRSGVTGVVDSGSRVLGQTYLLGSVERELRQAGYATHATVLEEETEDAVRDAFNQLIHRDVEGIVVMGSTIELTQVASRVSASIPVAIIDAVRTRKSGLIHVGVDSQDGAARATRHLIENGRRRVAHVSGPRRWTSAEGRIEGWRLALAQAGLVADALFEADWSPESGADAGRAIVAHGGIDAVFVGNDHMALGLMWALTEAGVRIPEDIAVIGFDNMPGSAVFTPPLSTMEQPFERLGAEAVKQILAALGSQQPQDVLLKARLVPRHSTVGRGPLPPHAADVATPS